MVRREWLLVVLPLAGVVALAGCGGPSSPTKRTAGPTSTAVSIAPTTSVAQTTSVAPTTSVASLGAGVEGTRTQVPWSTVGPGWILAEWTSAAAAEPGSSPPPAPVPTVLYLVDPAGGRYLVTTFVPNDSDRPGVLQAWSGDGRRALFTSSASVSGGSGLGTTVTELDLTTAVSHSFTFSGNSQAVGYTRPTGAAIVAAIGDGLTATLERLDTTGAVQLTYPASVTGGGSTAGGFLYSPDGAQLVAGTTRGLEVLSNGGQQVSSLPIESGASYCVPRRWWNPSTVLAECQASASRLWLVPLSGTPSTALTAALSGQGQDLGDEDAWTLPSGTFVQDAGPCGYQYLARLQPDGTTTPVDVPGVTKGDSVLVAGSYGSRLAISATLSCGPGETLAWYDPGAGSVTPLLGPPVNGGSVTNALLFPA